MKVTKSSISKLMDGRFIKFLNEAYTNNEIIDKNDVSKKVANELSSNRYHNLLPALVIDVNKGNGVSRPVPLFHVADYFVYYYCIKKLENKLALNRVPGTYGGWSLSGVNRTNETVESMEGDESLHSGLNPAAGAQQYGEFNIRIKRLLDKCPEDVKILEIDIANFYDTIRIDHLQRQIRSVSSKAQLQVVDLLFYFIVNCNKLLHSYRPQTTGIPQDEVGDCSRILANFYLQEYDLKMRKYCTRLGVKYLRFADDQIFIIPSSVNTEQVCREASKLLYSLGLNINQKKVRIWSKSKLIKYRCIQVFEFLDSKKLNAEQSPLECDSFAEKSLTLIKNSRKYKNPSHDIKGNGLPLIKKIIGLGINKLNATNRRQVIKEILKKGGYLKFLPEYNITKLYKNMNSLERKKLLDAIDILSSREIHAHFDYEVMKFKRNNMLKWKKHAAKVNKMTKEWRAN